MRNRKIQVTVNQLKKFIGDVTAVPTEPVGEHLSDDEAIGYTMEMLTAEEAQRVDTHVASCPECAEVVETLCEAHERQKVKHLEARRLILHQMDWLCVIANVAFRAYRLSRVRTRGTHFRAGERLFQDWTSEEGITCVLSEEEHGLVFTVDTTDQYRSGSLIRFALADEKMGDEYAAGLLVLHPDPSNEGHYVASARLADDVVLPENCQPRLDFVELVRTQSPDREALLNAASSAAEDADRKAWRDWARREESAERLSKELVEAIWQCTGDDA